MTSKLVLAPPVLSSHLSLFFFLLACGTCLSFLALGMQINQEYHHSTPGVKPAIVSPFGNFQGCLRHPEDSTVSRKCWGFLASDVTCFGGVLPSVLLLPAEWQEVPEEGNAGQSHASVRCACSPLPCPASAMMPWPKIWCEHSTATNIPGWIKQESHSFSSFLQQGMV